MQSDSWYIIIFVSICIYTVTLTECKGDCDMKYNPACKARKESKSEEIGNKIEIVANDLNAIVNDLQEVADKQKKDLGI